MLERGGCVGDEVVYPGASGADETWGKGLRGGEKPSCGPWRRAVGLLAAKGGAGVLKAAESLASSRLSFLGLQALWKKPSEYGFYQETGLRPSSCLLLMKLRPLDFSSALSPCHPGYLSRRIYEAELPQFVSGVVLAGWPERAVGQCAAGSS